MTYEIRHDIQDGIERIVYVPAERKFQTPIVMQHGMWHTARTWRLWQELLAEWGWETHAHSLPGHGGSPVRRPIRWCTLGYYLKFLRAEVERMARPPVLIGHSMGGALTQWYLKYVGDLPAAVLVAPWSSHGNIWDGYTRFFSLDPVGVALMSLTLTATPMIRTPQRAARMFITEGAALTPEELHAQLGPESVIVCLNHLQPWWRPRRDVRTPLLWLAGEQDAVISEGVERNSAAFYGADYVVVPGAGHNLMMERSYRETAQKIHNWLVEHNIL